ncbi:M23 family metallopeptidase [Aliidiomarina soli]|uniref:Peptidase n=1 Tax=Aliidiomarina soli TaxID=1928574 RepID=A0A432WM84_9GAMM|nr:M23 family metallopeptidase [Aliidiomarina soli]RUO34926.1 peptidase [Aliidiomarina soli]
MRKWYGLPGILLLAGLGSVQADEHVSEHRLNDYVQLQGQLTQGALVVGKTEPGFKVRLNGEELTVGEYGYFVFGLPREADAEQTLTVTDAEGSEHSSTLDVASREFNIQRIEGLPQQTVTPDPAAQERIRAENQQVAQARQVRSKMTYFTGPYAWPAEGRISGVYGSQRILNGEPRAPHWGIDIAAPTGTPVYAPIGGIVVLAHPDMLMSGGTLIVDHGHGVFSSFLHLHRIYVDVGDYLQQGDPIAEIGATGRATGPHLDWRMNWESTRVDPQLLLPPRD